MKGRGRERRQEERGERKRCTRGEGERGGKRDEEEVRGDAIVQNCISLLSFDGCCAWGCTLLQQQRHRRVPGCGSHEQNGHRAGAVLIHKGHND